MKYYLAIMICLFISCNSNERNEVDTPSKYSNGIFCADVTYYNSYTGTKHTYTLNVEVENNELVKILWNNGGWLDDSHFRPQELDIDGYCSFTSDKGYKYQIQITGSECNSTDERKVQYDKEESTCPKCDEEKETYEKYCSSCKRKIEDEKEDKEEHTCKKCGKYDSFMFSMDDECSDCKRKQEEEEER